MAHAGGRCAPLRRARRPLSSCDPTEEIFAVARALPPGLVDAIAAGHTHQAVAHRVAGLPVVQAHSGGRAFRAPRSHRRSGARAGAWSVRPLRAPHPLRRQRASPPSPPTPASPPPYEGRPVALRRRLAALLAPDVARAAELRSRPVGHPAARARAPGDAARNRRSATWPPTCCARRRPGADVGFINGGSLRSDLPAGAAPLRRPLPGLPLRRRHRRRCASPPRQLTAMVARNLGRDAGILSLSGVRARARCGAGRPRGHAAGSGRASRSPPAAPAASPSPTATWPAAATA